MEASALQVPVGFARLSLSAPLLRLRSDDQLVALFRAGKDVELLQAPISGFDTTGDGQSIDVVDTAKMAELAQAMKKDKLSEYVKKYPQG